MKNCLPRLKKFRNRSRVAGVAQLVEQLICNQLVAGSSPVVSSISGVSEAVITMVCLTIITGSIPVRLAISLGIPLKTRGSL